MATLRPGSAQNGQIVPDLAMKKVNGKKEWQEQEEEEVGHGEGGNEFLKGWAKRFWLGNQKELDLVIETILT